MIALDCYNIYMNSLDKYFDFIANEEHIYQQWEDLGLFTPTEGQNKEQNFCIIMPPPNANESLHAGHGLSLALQDIQARFQRQMGKNVLYIPGLDHAGFETQFVFENKLSIEGKSRFSFSREQLYQDIYDYVESNKNLIITQIRKLGISCDWSRLTFTLDKHSIDTTQNTFIKMFKEGLIYRDERIVNYSPKYQTTFSNLEIKHIEKEDSLYYIKYPLLDKNGNVSPEFVPVATVRPETMLADEAIVVHPEDGRYKHLIGKIARLPIVNKDIPIIADNVIDPDFGSGAVKVTPGHSETDFAIAKRHNLPIINILNPDGTLNKNGLHFEGKSVLVAREAVVKELEASNLIADIVSYKHQVACNYKDKEDIIEPIVKKQWLLRMEHFAGSIMKVLRDQEITISPESERKTLEHWLENIQDWNLSRQIVWGINIPVFYNKDDEDDFIVGTRDEAIKAYGQNGFIEETDVFDTWFSSGQWPLTVLSYPDSKDMQDFYPTQWLDTAADIVFFWVARMILFGLYLTKDVPFKKVYFHGLVADKQGNKMSKSKNNGINPIVITNEYGADAFRLGIISRAKAGKKQSFSEEIVASERNFLTKLWNIARFIENVAMTDSKDGEQLELSSMADHWISSQYNNMLTSILHYYHNDDFAMVLNSLQRFVWDDLADYYVEYSKVNLNAALLRHIYFGVLTALHPIAPFMSEYLWQYFYPQRGLMAQEKYPSSIAYVDATASENFADLIVSIKRLRFISKAIKAKPMVVLGSDWSKFEKDFLLKSSGSVVTENTSQYLRPLSANSGISIALSEQWHKDLEEARLTIIKELEQRRMHIEQRLSSQDYIDKAPVELIEDSKDQLEKIKTELDLLKSF